ncbi:MAG: high-affinity iron transporter [Clostridium sp.]
MRKLYNLTLVLLLVFTVKFTVLADVNTDLTKANKLVIQAMDLAKSNDLVKAQEIYNTYNKEWIALEDGVKKKSKQAYGDIEDKMGMVQFLFSQKPIQQDKLLEAFEELKEVNNKFIKGGYDEEAKADTGKKATMPDLLLLLQKSKKQIGQEDYNGALETMKKFTTSWLDIEGVVLTQSQKVYNDSEKDMVSIKGYLSMNSPKAEEAIKTIDKMYEYLAPLASKTSYNIMDAITIILREGLEALLVVIALLAFLEKSGNEEKKGWIYGGVGIGIGVSIVLAVLVQVLFSSGTFGNNNFLITGYTGVFAALMLIYMSYWLHSKSNVDEWQEYIKNKSTKALATGSLFSLGLLAFLAVFREGTEIVLFYIGMASAIKITDLLLGMFIGFVILAIIAILMLKIGLRFPIKPFFLISSLLVFYLGIKFTGMGINGLQLGGVLPATTSEILPTISWIAVHPSWEGFVPQALMVIGAIVTVLWSKIKNKTNKQRNK